MKITSSDLPPTGADWNPSEYILHSSAQERWAAEVHARLGLTGNENVIDLGCGDGRMTMALAQRLPAGKVVGVDSSKTMIDFAQGAHRDVTNLRFVLGDARSFTAGVLADRIVSTACLHWVDDQESVLGRCRLHLRRGGRIFFQMGGRGNAEAMMEVAKEVMASERWSKRMSTFKLPWRFPGPEDYKQWLPRHGFKEIRCELIPRPSEYRDGEQLLGWLRTTWFPLAESAGSEGEELLREIRDAYLQSHPPQPDGSTHMEMIRLEVEAEAI